MNKGQSFSVASISFSADGLKASEQILDACTYVRDQEITMVGADDLVRKFVHGCGAVDQIMHTGETYTVTFAIKRDMDVLKVLLPQKYTDGAQAGEYLQLDNAGKLAQKHEIKIRPLGATDDTNAIKFTAFVTEIPNTTATASGIDYAQIMLDATMIDVNGDKRTELKEYGVDFPVA